MASLTTAFDNVSQQFCCSNPYNFILHEYYDSDEDSSCLSDTHCGVDEGYIAIITHQYHMVPTEVLIPTHASLYHTAPAYRQVARNSHDAIIDPPSITRLSHMITGASPTYEKVPNAAYAIERDQECIYLCE